MKKTLILAMVGVLLISGSAFAAGRQLVAQPNATFNPGIGGAGVGPATTNNDDSCDIGTAPAATLLLPYFEVDLAAAGAGRTTVFTVTNVSPYAQIAHIVLYTDWSFPVLDFNIFLTGYDVQSLNLFDIIGRGLIGGTTGTSTAAPNAASTTIGTTNNRFAPNAAGTTGTNPSVGTQPFLVSSANMFGNPNFLASVATNCAPGRLPGQLPGPLATDVRAALTTGRVTGVGIGCAPSDQVGSNHGANTAVGYATIDVAATCSQALPTETSYFTGEILFDNVLIGEYFDVNQSTTAGNYAGGNPMVHIRAVPEGGGAGSLPTGGTNLPYTFYDRYTFGLLPRTIDRRQPLPSAFAARWISGSAALFDTSYKIWREGYTGNDAFEALGLLNQCEAVDRNQDLAIAEFVRFDERENASVIGLGGIIVSPPPPGAPGIPEASKLSINNSLFPVLASGSTDVGGWMYMNLNNGGNLAALAAGAPASGLYSSARVGFGSTATTRDVSQNWVIVSMFAEGRYGTDFDAAWMGNGCSPALPIAAAAGVVQSPAGRIAPAGGVLVCPPGTTTTQATGGVGGYPFGTINCIGTNVTP
jgi:hypothetical protein